MKLNAIYLALFLINNTFFYNLANAQAIKDDPANKSEKEWTVLVYLNGHNNLDPFGKIDIKEMESVGSNEQVNIVVQWASSENTDTRRLYITHDESKDVTSPIIESLPRVDMGNYQSLTEFVKWGIQKYPAKHYFIDIWNHGGGWHTIKSAAHINDISWDDESGHSIKTEQLGQSMHDIANFLGRKIDILGTDACLMAMAEVLGEIQDSVQIFAGSEEVEPGAGWDYNGFLTNWYAKKSNEPKDVAQYLGDSYLNSYKQGSQGSADVTFSILDLEKVNGLWSAFGEFANAMNNSNSANDFTAMRETARQSRSFTYRDYVDLGDFLVNLKKNTTTTATVLPLVENILSQLNGVVLNNYTTNKYKKATGLSFWFPERADLYKKYSERYKNLNFNKNTHWVDVLNKVYAK